MRRFRWLPEVSQGVTIVALDGRQLARHQFHLTAKQMRAAHVDEEKHVGWAAGPPLPVTGCSRWAIRMEHPRTLLFFGTTLIGVCNAASNFGSGVWLGNNSAYSSARVTPDHPVVVRFSDNTSTTRTDVGHCEFNEGDAPSGWGTSPAVVDDKSATPKEEEYAVPANTVELEYDADAGTLAFRRGNMLTFQTILSGFSTGVVVRPWIHFPFRDNKQLLGNASMRYTIIGWA